MASFGDAISLETNAQVMKLLRDLERRPIPGVRNLHPAYCSLLIVFDPCVTDHEELEDRIRGRVEALESVELPAPRVVEIPVRYGGEFGPDLEGVAELHGVSPAEVVRIHSSGTYHVYFLGFVPGFAYLGGLPDAIATPRLAVPRKVVAPGSVGIAGNQTGVYPRPTPGGWRLIGRTPLELFRADRDPMSLVALGDEVRFVPIP
jgi:inhibitor of KinA